LTGGSAFRWVRDLLNVNTDQKSKLNFRQLDELAATISAGSDGVVVVPHLAGAGSPIWDPGASGIVTGLKLSHGAANLVRATMEGVVFAELHALDAVREHVPNISTLQLTGGGAKSDLWPQIMADAIGLPVTIPESQQSTCLGAAMMAGVATGVYSSHMEAVDSMTTTNRKIQPNSTLKNIYDDAYDTYLHASKVYLEKNVL
jgi:sugar (pentulose or hexulose) kinase